jgi:adenylyltransferase/sulfurtransferase
MATLRIPSPLRPYTDGASEIELQVDTVSAALEELTRKYPSLRKHLFTEDGEMRAFVNLFLNDEDVRYLQGVDTKVKVDDRLMIIPSIAGGVLI